MDWGTGKEDEHGKQGSKEARKQGGQVYLTRTTPTSPGGATRNSYMGIIGSAVGSASKSAGS
jgi:hypothetical protein